MTKRNHRVLGRPVGIDLHVVTLLSVLILSAASAAQAVSWPDAAYNPRPAPDDWLLPLPCGGALA
ncbi:hypothetical protein, partial [Thiocapsa marina]